MAGVDNDSDFEDVYDETTNFMASLSKRAGGVANNAWSLDDEDYDRYDGYQNEDPTEEQLAFCDALDIIFEVNLDDSLYIGIFMSLM